MSLRKKINLSLAIDLINSKNEKVLKTVLNSLSKINDLGLFKGIFVTKENKLSEVFDRNLYTLKYENATLELVTSTNLGTKRQYVDNLKIVPKF